MRMKFGCGALASMGLLGTALIVVVFYIALLRYQQVFNNGLQELQEQGMPISIADLEPEPVPPEENAATYLRRAEAACRAIDLELAEISGGPSDQASEEFLSRFAESTAAFPHVYQQLSQAARAPHYSPDLDSTASSQDFLNQVYEESGRLRSVSRVLGYGSKAARAEGDFEKAAGLALDGLRIARKAGQLPALVSYLSSLGMNAGAIETLNATLQGNTVSEEMRRAIDNELAAHDRTLLLERTMITERAVGVSMVEEQFGSMWLPMMGFQARGYLELIQMQIEAAQQPIHEQNYEPMPMFAGTYGALAAMVPLSQTRSYARVAICEVRALRLINKLASVEGDPPILENLGLPPEALLDPYTGKPMIVKKVDGGWSVYSVGADKVDHGGNYVDSMYDIGFGPGLVESRESGVDR